MTFDRAGVGHLSRALIHVSFNALRLSAQLVPVAQRSRRSPLSSKAALGMSQGERGTLDPHLGQTTRLCSPPAFVACRARWLSPLTRLSSSLFLSFQPPLQEAFPLKPVFLLPYTHNSGLHADTRIDNNGLAQIRGWMTTRKAVMDVDTHTYSDTDRHIHLLDARATDRHKCKRERGHR